MVLDSFTDSFDNVVGLFSATSTDNKALTCLYKTGAICVLSKISTDICKESGNKVVSDMIDICTRIIVFSLTLPFISSIIKTAASFAK